MYPKNNDMLKQIFVRMFSQLFNNQLYLLFFDDHPSAVIQTYCISSKRRFSYILMICLHVKC